MSDTSPGLSGWTGGYVIDLQRLQSACSSTVRPSISPKEDKCAVDIGYLRRRHKVRSGGTKGKEILRTTVQEELEAQKCRKRSRTDSSSSAYSACLQGVRQEGRQLKSLHCYPEPTDEGKLAVDNVENLVRDCRLALKRYREERELIMVATHGSASPSEGPSQSLHDEVARAATIFLAQKVAATPSIRGLKAEKTPYWQMGARWNTVPGQDNIRDESTAKLLDDAYELSKGFSN